MIGINLLLIQMSTNVTNSIIFVDLVRMVTFLRVTIKIMKYQILCPMNVDWTIFEKHLRNLTYQVRTISNRTIQQLWEFDALSFDYFKQRGTYPTVQDLYGCTQKKIDGYIYHT
ncbi:hypothetical protein C6Y54_28555 [Bacillus cereus]|nr:hypothetical protein C6Y54_28555 [Bacillus cereus]